jgi:hypothetical protein
MASLHFVDCRTTEAAVKHAKSLKDPTNPQIVWLAGCRNQASEEEIREYVKSNVVISQILLSGARMMASHLMSSRSQSFRAGKDSQKVEHRKWSGQQEPEGNLS